MSDGVVWREPPAEALKRSRLGMYSTFADELRNNPGRWALLPGDDRTPKGAHGTAQNLRQARMKDFKPKGAWEAVAHDTDVYVRFVGEPAQAEPQPESDEAEPEEDEVPPARIREWAKSQGKVIPDRGRLPGDVVEAYYRAHTRPKHLGVVRAEGQ